MYGWIAEGISSIFEPVTGHSNPDWPGNGEQRPGGTVVTAGPHRAHCHPRPAKRSYQSVHVSNGAAQGEQREAKRRKLDVVLSFVKRTVARVAGLFRLGRGQNTDCEQYRRHEESKNQPVTLMGIHEIRTSWLTGSEWRMDKSSGGAMERDRPGRSALPSSSPLSIRRYSGAVLCGGGPDGGRDRGAALPSRSALGVGLGAPSPGAELPHLCFGHSRCYKPSLTVEEAIKQSDKERYRRLLEMVVTEKYSKTQPLPFSRTTPADATPASNDGRPGRFAKPLDSGPWRTASISATPNAFSWRNAAAAAASHARDWRPGGVFTKALGGASGDKLPRGLKQGHAPQEDLSAEVASRLSLLDRETPAPGRHADPTVTPAFGEHDLPRLTTVMAGEVSAALNQADPSLVLSAAFKLRITQRDLSTLREGSWLNDEVINFYLSLVTERSARQDPPGPRVYCFSTFFLPKLRGGAGGGGHQAVRRWTKAVDLFLQDLVLVPLHLDTHWALAVIDLRSQTVRSYDSMGQRHDDICSMLLMFLTEEHRVKKGRELDASRWTLGSLRPSEIPQQKNGSDCGVFACKYADYVSRGRPLTFRQCHMPLFRKAMVWEILNKKLL